jgi:hypothetical protein
MKMNKKFIIIAQIILLFVWTHAQATSDSYDVRLGKATYTSQEAINITFANLPTHNDDWIGIYPKNANNSWVNVVSWRFTNGTKSSATVGKSSGTLLLDKLAVGEYEARLFFNNSYRLEARVAFSVTDNPPLAIITSDVEDVNENSVDINFDLNQRAQGQVEYGTTTNYGYFSTKETSFTYASHRQRLTNLIPNTRYHYRIHAFNRDGIEVISENRTFVIKPGLSILSSDVENIDQSSVYVHFDLNQKAHGQIEYGTTTEYGNFTNKEESFTYASHRQIVSNLKANITYHYRVHAIDENGVEFISEDKTFSVTPIKIGLTASGKKIPFGSGFINIWNNPKGADKMVMRVRGLAPYQRVVLFITQDQKPGGLPAQILAEFTTNAKGQGFLKIRSEIVSWPDAAIPLSSL